MNQLANRESISDARATEQCHEEVRTKAACFAAAAEISHPDFPFRPLPRVAPIPYANLGHLVLFNYEIFARAMWVTALDLRDAAEQHDKHQSPHITAAAVACGLVAFALLAAKNWFALPFGGALVALLVYQAAAKTQRIEEFDRSVNRLKSNAVEKLLRCDLSGLQEHSDLNHNWISWGSGQLDARRMPVLIAAEERLFPGFGDARLRQVFAVPEADDSERGEDDELQGDPIYRRILKAAQCSGFPHVTTGRVVVVDGNTLCSDSPWLSADGSPLLWTDEPLLASLQERDARASARAYTAVQVLLPHTPILLTFFLRTFKTGHSAALELHLLTLGALKHHPLAVLQRLKTLRHAATDQKPSDPQAPAKLQYGRWLQSVRAVLAASGPSLLQKLFTDQQETPEHLVPFSAKEYAEISRGTLELSGCLAYWVGDLLMKSNWREENSISTTTDLFAQTEIHAALRLLYKQIVTAGLDALQDQGFDISEYRDKDGQWHIHADKIDNLMVGKSITVSQGSDGKEGKEENERKEAEKKMATTQEPKAA